MHPKLTPAAAEVLQVKYSLSHDGGTNFWSFFFFRFSFAIRQLSLSYLDHGSATIQRFFFGKRAIYMGEFSAQLSYEAMDREEESFGKISDPEPAWWTMLL